MLVHLASYLHEPYNQILTLLAPIFATGFLWIVPAIKRKFLRWSYTRAINKWSALLKSPHELSDAVVDRISEMLDDALVARAHEDLALPPGASDGDINDVSHQEDQEGRRSTTNVKARAIPGHSVDSKPSKKLPKARATMKNA
jgi:hypothetical protein